MLIRLFLAIAQKARTADSSDWGGQEYTGAFGQRPGKGQLPRRCQPRTVSTDKVATAGCGISRAGHLDDASLRIEVDAKSRRRVGRERDFSQVIEGGGEGAREGFSSRRRISRTSDAVDNTISEQEDPPPACGQVRLKGHVAEAIEGRRKDAVAGEIKRAAAGCGIS